MGTAAVVVFGVSAIIAGWTADGYQRHWLIGVRMIAFAAGSLTFALGLALLLGAFTGSITIEWPHDG